MYDFRVDIAELRRSLEDLYGQVEEDLVRTIEGVEADDDVVLREKIYGLLKDKIDGLDEFRTKASLDVEPVTQHEWLSGHSGLTKSLPFFVACSLAIVSQKQRALTGSTENVFNQLTKEQNLRYHDFRLSSKGFRSNDKVLDFARANAFNVPDKVTIGEKTAAAPFSLKIGLSFDAKYREFNAKAREYLYGADFKISSQSINGTLKERLRATLASGYAGGDTRQGMVDRVRSVLGSRSNAETIAITEVASAVNFGEYEFAKEFRDRQGVELIKTWFQIERTSKRKAHTSVVGQSLKFEEKFLVDGERMDRPHDPDASSRNVIRCGCYLEYEEGKASVKGAEDARGVRRYIDSVENMPSEEPYVNAERIGNFWNVEDGVEYVRDVYGVLVDREFSLEQMNSIANVLDSMPAEVMLKNMKLTEMFASGAAAENLAEYALDGKWLRFNEHRDVPDVVFEHTLAHEIGHSLHYQSPELFEKFAHISWNRVNEGSVFSPANWEKKSRNGFLSSNSMKNPKEHFADSVSWYVTRNSEMAEVARRQAQRGSPELKAIFELFAKHFGPVKP